MTLKVDLKAFILRFKLIRDSRNLKWGFKTFHKVAVSRENN